jgi:hypothetical protein
MADNQQEKPQEDKAQEEKPKIIVDDDWKAQAQAEKEKLDEEIKAKQEAEGGEGEPAGPGGRRLPPASFATLVNSLGAQALLALGGYEDPKTKRRLVDLDLAKHHIDSLAVLEDKTKGNLTDEEQKLLDGVLYEARMQFVQFAQRLSQVTAPPGRPQAQGKAQGRA